MIFLTGEHGAGKTHLAQVYQKHFGCEYVDLGPTLRRIWMETSPNTSFADFLKRGEEKSGIDFTNQLLVDEIEKQMGRRAENCCTGRLLIIGSRSVQGLQYIRGKTQDINGNTRAVVYIQADEDKLYLHYKEREQREISYQEFQLLLQRDRQMGILGIRGVADYVIENNDNALAFEKRGTEIFNQILNTPKKVRG